MDKNTIVQFFLEYVNGVWKGSMNRFLALILVLVIAFCGIYPTVHTNYKDIPLEFIGILVTLVAALLGISGYSKNLDIKNTTANPNLPDPNKK